MPTIQWYAQLDLVLIIPVMLDWNCTSNFEDTSKFGKVLWQTDRRTDRRRSYFVADDTKFQYGQTNMKPYEKEIHCCIAEICRKNIKTKVQTTYKSI